jgi:hypothetical protein
MSWLTQLSLIKSTYSELTEFSRYSILLDAYLVSESFLLLGTSVLLAGAFLTKKSLYVRRKSCQIPTKLLLVLGAYSLF